MHSNEEWSQRLKELVTLEPTVAHREEVKEAIATKREGLRVLSARVLAQWGDIESKECLKSLLTYHCQRQSGWGATGAITHSIAPLLDTSDLDWALELYLTKSNPRVRFTMISMFQTFDHAVLRNKLDKRLEQLKGANSRDIRMIKRKLPNDA